MKIPRSLRDAAASRRDVLIGGAGLVAAASLPRATFAAEAKAASPSSSHGQNGGTQPMTMITMKDGTEIYCKNWGSGQPVVFSHGWPLSSDAWEAQMVFVADNGYRAVAHDRRGHGRSSQPWNGNEMDTYADDLATVIETLDLRDIVLVGHSYDGWVKTLNWILEQDIEHIYVGHYTPATKEDQRATRDYLVSLHDQVRELTRQGQSWDQLYRNVKFTDEQKSWFGYEFMRVPNIQGMYRWVSNRRRGVW
jgi:hypothetical protein